MRLQARRWWVSIHKWIGITFGILFLFEAITGCILVYQHEISEALDTPLRVSGPPVTVLTSVDQAIAAARAIDPGARPTLIALPGSNPDRAYRILQSSGERGRPREVWVDPVTGLATTDHRRPVQAVLDFVWTLHKRLATPFFGDLLVAISGLILVVSTISGIVLWWPRTGKWAQALTVKRGAKLPRFTFDLHRVAGILLAAMCLLWGISGTYMLRPSWITGWLPTAWQPINEQSAAGAGRNAKKPKPAPLTTPLLPPATPSAILSLAAKAVPGSSPLFLFPPRDIQDCKWRVRVERSNDLVRYIGSTNVMVDACNRKVLATIDERGDTASNVFYWLRPLHSGEAFGAPGKLLVLVLGVVFAKLGVTGILLWWIRKRARSQSRHRLFRDF